MTLKGSLEGNMTEGIRQQSSPPTSSSLNLTIQAAVAGANPLAVDFVIQPASDPASTDSSAIDPFACFVRYRRF